MLCNSHACFSFPTRALEKHAWEKKGKCEKVCVERRCSFMPLIYSVDGMPCTEARAWERRVASKLAEKWNARFGKMVSYVRTRMSLAIIRSNTLLLHGERAHYWHRKGPEDGVAFSALAQGRVD